MAEGHPQSYPLVELERGGSAAGIIIPILTVFLAVLLVGGGGIFLTYTIMNHDGAETAAAQPSPPSTSRPNFNTPRTSSSDQKIESIDDAVASLQSSSISTRREALDWLAGKSVDSRRQAEVVQLLNTQLLQDRHNEDQILDALTVWATRDSVPALRKALEEGRGDENQLLKLLARFPDQESAEVIAKQLESASTATDAVAALKAIGPPARTAVAKHLGSSNRTADQYARQLLQEWGVDVKDALIGRLIQDLKSTDRTVRARAAKSLAGEEVVESRQDEVAQALNSMLLMDDDTGKVDALRAVQVWGNENSIPAIIHVAKKGTGYSSSPAAMEILAETNDPRAAAALCELLTDFSKQQKAKACLAKMSKEVVEPEIAKYYNHPDFRTRQQARLLLHSFDTEDSLILRQCIEDLGSAELERHKGAAEWLATADVVDEQRNEVADRLSKLLDSNEFGLRENAPIAFARWATENQVDKLYGLLDSRDSKVRIAALKLLVYAGDAKILAPQLAELLGSRLTRDAAIAVLDEAGPAAEDVMIYLLASADHDVLALTCQYMFHHGTEKSLEPLAEFRTAAARAGEKDLVEAARRASTEILARARKQPDAEGS